MKKFIIVALMVITVTAAAFTTRSAEMNPNCGSTIAPNPCPRFIGEGQFTMNCPFPVYIPYTVCCYHLGN